MSSANDLVLEANSISIVFGGLRAVSDFSCSLYKGEVVGLIGPNGAGKTTIFNMLSCVYKPTDGQISFWDKNGNVHNTGRLQAFQLHKLGVARTFQNIRLFQNLSVQDNVKIALHAQRKANLFHVLFRTRRFRHDERRIQQRVDELLQLFKIYEKREELAKNLPYGEQRKLEIVRALASSPKLLLLDEPAAGMNPQETDELMNLIKFIRDKFDITILLIEHDMHLVMGICQRLIVLDYGRVIASGDPETVTKDPVVIKAYLGEEALNDA